MLRTARAKGYKYVDKTLAAGTVKQLTWRRGKDLKATLSGRGPSALDYDLQEGLSQNPVQGQLLSGQVGVCFACSPAVRDGSDGRTFSAKADDCPAPVTCGP